MGRPKMVGVPYLQTNPPWFKGSPSQIQNNPGRFPKWGINAWLTGKNYCHNQTDSTENS